MTVRTGRAAVGGDRLSGRQAWRLLWAASKPLSIGVLAWAALDAIDGRLSRFLANRYAREFTEAIRAGHESLRGLHRRAAACFAVVVAGNAFAIYVITDAARHHQIGLRSMAIMLPMLAMTMAAGSVSYDDITLPWTLAGLPDAHRLEGDLAARTEPDGGAKDPAARRGTASGSRTCDSATRPAPATFCPASTWTSRPAPPPPWSG